VTLNSALQNYLATHHHALFFALVCSCQKKGTHFPQLFTLIMLFPILPEKEKKKPAYLPFNSET
jgi:hypothetical protein